MPDHFATATGTSVCCSCTPIDIEPTYSLTSKMKFYLKAYELHRVVCEWDVTWACRIAEVIPILQLTEHSDIVG